MSSFLDLAYRISIGQILYSDVQFNAGPVFPLFYAIFVKCFGVNQIAIISFLAFLNLLLWLAAHQLIMVVMPRIPTWAEVCLLIGVVVFTWGPIRHPWYDQLAWIFLMFSLAFHQKQIPRPVDGVASGFFWALTFLSKSNVGLFSLLFLVLLMNPRPAKMYISFFLGSLIATGASFVSARASPMAFVIETLIIYRPEARFFDFQKLLQIILSPIFLSTATLWIIAAIYLIRSKDVKNARILSLAFGVWVIGVIGNWTGTVRQDRYLVFIGPMLICLVPILAEMFRLKEKLAVRMAPIVSILIVLWCAWPSIAEPRFWDWKLSSQSSNMYMEIDEFSGWSCNTIDCIGFENAVTALRQLQLKDQDLIVVGQGYHIYGLLEIASYRPAPFQFVPGDFPPKGPWLNQFLRQLNNSPPKYILISNTGESNLSTGYLSFQYLGLEPFIILNYRRERIFSGYELYRRI